MFNPLENFLNANETTKIEPIGNVLNFRLNFHSFYF